MNLYLKFPSAIIPIYILCHVSSLLSPKESGSLGSACVVLKVPSTCIMQSGVF